MTQEPFIHKIDNEQTAQLPAIEFRGKICIIDREEQVEEACLHLASQPVIGFDTETRPSFKAGVSYRVSLLQLSSEERCYLFRLNKIALSKPILKLLENPALIEQAWKEHKAKVGDGYVCGLPADLEPEILPRPEK